MILLPGPIPTPVLSPEGRGPAGMGRYASLDTWDGRFTFGTEAD